MNDVWMEIFKMFFDAGKLDRLAALLHEQALLDGRMACQIGQDPKVRDDALADMRFCLSKSDEAQKALMAMREKASSRAAGGFQEGGPALA